MLMIKFREVRVSQKGAPSFFTNHHREHFWVIGLANNHRILFNVLISLGTVKKTFVDLIEFGL